MADHEPADKSHDEGVRDAERHGVDAELVEEQRRHRDDVAAGRNGEAHEVAVHDRGVDVEAREAPHAADREEDRDDDAEDAVVVQHEGPGEERRCDAK